MFKFQILFKDFLGITVLHEGKATYHRQMQLLRAYDAIHLGEEDRDFRWHGTPDNFVRSGYFQEHAPAKRKIYVSND